MKRLDKGDIKKHHKIDYSAKFMAHFLLKFRKYIYLALMAAIFLSLICHQKSYPILPKTKVR